MKRILLSIALLAAVFSFSSCKKEQLDCKQIADVYPVYITNSDGSQTLKGYVLELSDRSLVNVSVIEVLNYRQGLRYCK